MALGSGVVEPTVAPALTIDYADVWTAYLKLNHPIIASMRKIGFKQYQMNRTHFRGIFQKTVGGFVRFYGPSDPDGDLETCEAAIQSCHFDVFYNKMWAGSRIKNEAFVEGVPPSAMVNVPERNLQSMVTDTYNEYERMLCSTTGNAVLFQLADAGTDNLDGTWTFLIQNYGGIAGQELGHIVRNLNLGDVLLQASSAVGVAAVATGRSVVSWDDTLGAESITVDGDLGDTGGGTPAAAGWVVFRSRMQSGGIQGAEDALYGYEALIDNGTIINPFQNLDVLDPDHPTSDCFAQNFISTVIDGNGQPLSEALMINMISAAEVFGATAPEDSTQAEGFMIPEVFFTMDPLNWNLVCTSALNLRQMTAPNMWGDSGIRPRLGFDTKQFQLNGYPIYRSHMHQRNSVYLVDGRSIGFVHNGPLEGQWFMGDGFGRAIPVPCTTKSEYKRWAYLQTAVLGPRSTCVKLNNLTSPQTF